MAAFLCIVLIAMGTHWPLFVFKHGPCTIALFFFFFFLSFSLILFTAKRAQAWLEELESFRLVLIDFKAILIFVIVTLQSTAKFVIITNNAMQCNANFVWCLF